jgi:hypothetical protein
MTIRWTRSLAALALPLTLLVAVPAVGQGGPGKIRGTLSAVDGETLTVQNDDGETHSYPLKEGAGIFIVTPASLDEIKTGDFVGVTSIERDGQRIALETHVFSEELRGTGEGHYAWDLVQEPNMMTNATIAKVKETEGGRTLEVEYQANEQTGREAGSQTLIIPADAPIVRLEKAADRSPLSAGKDVFMMVEPAKDGPPLAIAVVVGEKGASPPM